MKYPQKYKNNEYCKDIGCKVIEEIEDGKNVESVCKTMCRAYDFHDWLIKHNYEILK